MSNSEDRMTKLLDFPYGSYLMLRLEYVLICGDELEAKIMRLIEMYMDNDRKKLLQEYLNSTKDCKPADQVNITKDVWAPISYRLFMYDLYDQVKSENTLKRAIKSLQKKNFINVKFEQSNRYDAPKYQINVGVVQEEFNKLQKQGKLGYQRLTPSKLDTLKDSYPQNLTPSEDQNLTPSNDDLSTGRGSNSDTNSRSNSNNSTVESESVVSDETDTNTPALSEITHTPPTEEPTQPEESKSEETPEEPAQEKKSRKRTTRRSRASKFEIPEELAPRVKKIYEFLNDWGKKMTGEPVEWFSPNVENNEAICSLFTGKPPTEKTLEQVCNAMWSEPRNPRTGYYAREHMTVKAICNQYKAKSLLLAVNENKKDKAPGVVTPYNLGGYSYKPEDEQQPQLPFAGPFRNNRKKRGA